MAKRIIQTTSTSIQPDFSQEQIQSLRPQCFSEYIGQTQIVENLKVAIRSAKTRKSPLDHILLYGSAGLGKTSLAGVVANEMGSNIKVISGPAIEKPGDVVAALNSLEANDILFIDEIHRMEMRCEEVLYSAMEDGFVTISIGKDGQAKTINLDLPPFTLIGATTKAGSLSKPLRDRFGLCFKLNPYSIDELSEIIMLTAGKFNLTIKSDEAKAIARVSRGIPRIANRYAARVRDYVYAAHLATDGSSILVTCEDIEAVFGLLGIDERGLDDVDRAILKALTVGKPLGLNTLAEMLGEDAGTIECVYEPYLLSEGYLIKTPRGREATEKAYSALGVNQVTQLSLF